MPNHITKTVAEILGFLGPFEGDLLVEITSNGESWLLSPDEAVAFVRGNPRQEFTATEKWRLS